MVLCQGNVGNAVVSQMHRKTNSLEGMCHVQDLNVLYCYSDSVASVLSYRGLTCSFDVPRPKQKGTRKSIIPTKVTVHSGIRNFNGQRM